MLSVVINRSEAANMCSTASKLQAPTKVKPRTYDDKPLPIQASEHAPRNATIINRVFEGGSVTFELKIGETIISEVGLDEVLDYVSAYHLEEYENAQFQQEEQLLKIAEEEDRKLKEEQHARRKERAKTKGTVIFESTTDGDQDATEAKVNIGKHGRARPSYKPLYNVFKQRRQRRKRDPKTGELIPLSDDDMVADMEQQESSSDDRLESKADLDPLSLENLPKRRRRKRDPVTGELLPLEPLDSTQTQRRNMKFSRFATVEDRPQSTDQDPLEKPKRPRRRRHPITNELMPLGWRYNLAEEQQRPAGGLKVSSLQSLSLSNESEPKRRRLDRIVSSNERSRSPDLVTRLVKDTHKPAVAPLSAFVRGDVISLHGSDSDDSATYSIDVRPAAPKPKLLRRGIGGASVAQNLVKSQSPSESPEPSGLATLPVRTSPRKSGLARTRSTESSSPMIPLQIDGSDSSSGEEAEEDAREVISQPQAKPVTSITHPSAVMVESSSSEESSEDGELPEDEYFVEAILAHAESNPATHPAHLGKEPVMLYKVKWEGWPDVTWEPETSFSNMDVVREYQQRVGLKQS
ncbi:hypothetical protein MBLNU13_g11616t1 [Cladosporium sp. NU13]